MAIYSGFYHWKWWFSIAMLNYQRVSRTVPSSLSWPPSPVLTRIVPREKRFNLGAAASMANPKRCPYPNCITYQLRFPKNHAIHSQKRNDLWVWPFLSMDIPKSHISPGESSCSIVQELPNPLAIAFGAVPSSAAAKRPSAKKGQKKMERKPSKIIIKPW